jgi:hypothetical protein
MPRRLRHIIRHTEQICRRCWEVRTQTEDGHQLSAFGITLKQAIYRVHQKAKAYGRYVYPTAAARERRDDVAHRLMTFVQDGSRAYHQPCAASVALSRQAMYCDVWSGESHQTSAARHVAVPSPSLCRRPRMRLSRPGERESMLRRPAATAMRCWRRSP